MDGLRLIFPLLPRLGCLIGALSHLDDVTLHDATLAASARITAAQIRMTKTP